jgi:hypothetical protein
MKIPSLSFVLLTPEWIKILVTAVVSLMTGLAIEPWRSSLARYLTAKRAIKMLYFELVRLYETCNEMQHLPVTVVKLIFSRIVLEHYDYYYGQHREAFYLISQHDSLGGLFREIKLYLADAAEGKADPHQSAKDIIDAIEARIKGGVVDREIFDRAMRTMQKTAKPVREALGENIKQAMAQRGGSGT